MIVWFATGNVHKKKELSDILSSDIKSEDRMSVDNSSKFELKIPSEAGLVFNPEENGGSFFQNALIKAASLHGLLEKERPPFYKSGSPVIADDSGICVDALGGRPGIHSARYGGEKTPYTEKNAMLLAELGDNPNRRCRFVCAMVLYYGPDRFFAAQETVEGELVKSVAGIKGKGGFGYDPVFYLPELARTIAELSDEEKNFLSHRGKAGRAIARVLAAN